MFFEIIIGIILFLFLAFVLMYNSFITLKNSVKNSWSSIDIWLKRRESLIPNLVNTVKSYAKYEKDLLKEITTLRMTMINSEKDVKKTATADDMLTSTLKTLFAVSENYPKLKANKNFLKLQIELTKTENEIAAARRIYNNNVRDYNTKIDSFPSNIIANLFNFSKEEFFTATKKEKENIQANINELSNI